MISFIISCRSTQTREIISKISQDLKYAKIHLLLNIAFNIHPTNHPNHKIFVAYAQLLINCCSVKRCCVYSWCNSWNFISFELEKENRYSNVGGVRGRWHHTVLLLWKRQKWPSFLWTWGEVDWFGVSWSVTVTVFLILSLKLSFNERNNNIMLNVIPSQIRVQWCTQK